MHIRNLLLAASLVVVSVVPAAFAQPVRHPLVVNQRQEIQQDRIAQGVRSGQLTPRETARLERQEARINREERGMRAQDNGRLTRADRQLLSRQQNRESRRIEREKHNSFIE